MDVMVVLHGANQPAVFASALPGNQQFDLPRHDLGLQLREHCLAIGKAQAQSRDGRLRVDLQRKQRLPVGFDRVLANHETDFDLHGQSPKEQGDPILQPPARRMSAGTDPIKSNALVTYCNENKWTPPAKPGQTVRDLHAAAAEEGVGQQSALITTSRPAVRSRPPPGFHQLIRYCN
ncbi:hypothetical protein LP414_32260 [Polaromonas sp. P1(28)-13]|nr:hypothetical protein LP414_32260 [Polaromonas sp. P1(28)-13]